MCIIFSFVGQVLGTPHALNFLQILQNMLLLERGSPQADIVWPLLEDLTQSAVLLQDEKQTNNFHKVSLDKLKKAVIKSKEQATTASG